MADILSRFTRGKLQEKCAARPPFNKRQVFVIFSHSIDSTVGFLTRSKVHRAVGASSRAPHHRPMINFSVVVNLSLSG